jgi:cyanate lyase
MSAIDFYATIDKVEGTHGEQRIVITFNGALCSFQRRVLLFLNVWAFCSLH